MGSGVHRRSALPLRFRRPRARGQPRRQRTARHATPVRRRQVHPRQGLARLELVLELIYVLSSLARGKPPPCGNSGNTTSSSFMASPAVLLTVAPHTLPSGDIRSAQACPCVSWRTTSGGPVTAPVPWARWTATVCLVLTRLTSTVPSNAEQPPTPGRSGHVHTVETLESLVIRCSRSAVGARSRTNSEPSTGAVHSPPPAPIPLSAVVGGEGCSVVGCSRRITLPARDAGSLAIAGLPASPVITTSVVGLVKSSAPVFPLPPLGIPVRRSLGVSPSATRTTRLSVGVLM